MNFIQKLSERFGPKEIAYFSALNPIITKSGGGDGEAVIRKFITRTHPSCVLEIGTFNGVTTALLATMVEKVITIDIRFQQIQVQVWDYMGVKSKIQAYLITNEKEKEALIRTLDFDFAFVDGAHHSPYPTLDFGYVKRCGRVLFHDYNPNCSPGFLGVKEIVESLDHVEVDGIFAYWEEKNG